ncbi:MAG: integrase [Mucilaginibacter sp.]|nr:integrase [Mucilaginibacter sp.]
MFEAVFDTNLMFETGHIWRILLLINKFMKTTQSFGIDFTIRSDKKKDGKSPIYACITVNSKKCFFAVKQSIDLKTWDNRKGLPKGSKEEARAISSYLENLRRTLGNIYQQMLLKGVYLTAEAVKDNYFKTEIAIYKLSDLFQYHNETALATIKAITLFIEKKLIVNQF